jgi:hypothetical protein
MEHLLGATPQCREAIDVFPACSANKQLLVSDLLAEHDVELSEHHVQAIEVCRISQHVLQFS